MSWTLAPGVGFCAVGRDLVFLDLRRDRYFLLDGVRRAAFERLCSGEPNDGEAMTLLVETGLFIRSDVGSHIAPLAIDVPDADLSRPDDRRTEIRAIVTAWLALAWARRALNPDRLSSTIENRLQAKLRTPDPKGDEQLGAIAAEFARARVFVPISPRCLIDSLALYRIALRNGLAPTLVFGVRTNPFAAHCWLQSRSHILTGTAEEARNYRPLLAI